MISAFEVYLVMQLDAIRGGVLTLALLSGTGLLGTLMALSIGDVDEQECKKWRKWFLVLTPALTLLFSATPSTQTAAAMVIVPAITSQEVVDEASELYTMAKEALRDALPKKEEEVK